MDVNRINTLTSDNVNFGKFNLRSLESRRNRKLTGNVVKDTFIKYPRTIVLGTTLAALLTAGGLMVSSSVEKSRAQKAAEIAETSDLFEKASQVDLSAKLYQKAKKHLSDWNIGKKIIYKDDQPCEMVVMKFSPKYDIINDTYNYTQQAFPPYIKNAFGLNDRVLNKYNDLHSVLTDEYRSGHSDFDKDLFKPGAQIVFPVSEIGKNKQRAEEFYLELIR